MITGDDISGRIEEIYGMLARTGKCRFIKINYPYTHMEDKISSDICWDIYSTFDTTVKCELYVNSVSGDYKAIALFKDTGISEGTIKDRLSENFKDKIIGDFIYPGKEGYEGLSVFIDDVRKTDTEIRVTASVNLPSILRMENIVKFYNRERQSIIYNRGIQQIN
jgi:hypothetical protein